MPALVDRYVFFEWLRAFILSVGAILGILLLEDIFNNLKDLLDYGAGLPEVTRYYLVLIPSLVTTVLPLALMVSILFSLGNLHRNNEIVAMRANGLSVMRITRTLWLMGIVLAATVFHLNAKWTPWSIEQSRQIWENYRFADQLAQGDNDEIGLIYNLAFHNHADGRIWFLNRFSEFDYRAFGVTVSQVNESGREQLRIIANEGHFDEYTGNWSFRQGREIEFDTETGEPIRSQVFEREVYPDLHDDPHLMRFLERRPRDLSFNEISRILELAPPAENPRVLPYEVRYFAILTSPLTSLFAVAIAIPFAVGGVRVNPMVGVSKSIGLFALYYVIYNVCTLLGEKAILSPPLAAILPLLFVIPVLVWLYRTSI